MKQGKVVSYEGSGIVQLNLLQAEDVPKKRTGRFELIYDDEEEGNENCNNVSVELSDMVDAKLVQRCVEGGSH